MEWENKAENKVKSKAENLSKLNQANFVLNTLTVYRPLLQDEFIKTLYELISHLDSETPEFIRATELYSSICHKLFNAGTGLNVSIIEKILHSENPFARKAEAETEVEAKAKAGLAGSIFTAVKRDLEVLQLLANLEPEMVKDWIVKRCAKAAWQQEAVWNLPSWDVTPGQIARNSVRIADKSPEFMKELLLHSDCWSDCIPQLAQFHQQSGSGIFSKYRALVWRQVNKTGEREGEFLGVDFPDPVRFSDLVSYELERSSVIENTLRFLEGYPANNILLYGDRGTGKSTTVKALVNEYHDRGLRMIEVPKRLLSDFPVIIRRLAGRNLKFILFVDDLAFEDNEENYTALKAALEGGLESRPSNVLIYATSNRKHLIKEKFSDRAGLVSGNADDEVRAADTMQEKLSLSDRFGMTVIFSSPDKRRYLEIVEGIIKGRGLEIDKDLLHREALKWELNYNGRSPRTARQFADWLEGFVAEAKNDA